jgi:hypothetical protein
MIQGRKCTKYAAVAETTRGGKFLAFVLESYGAFGPQALDILKILYTALSNSPSSPTSLTRSFIVESIAIALQRGNALVSQTGLIACKTQAC